MKTLFKFKNLPEIKYMTNDQAEELYKLGGKEFPVRVSIGFYSDKLHFRDWLDRYKIKIL